MGGKTRSNVKPQLFLDVLSSAWQPEWGCFLVEVIELGAAKKSRTQNIHQFLISSKNETGSLGCFWPPICPWNPRVRESQFCFSDAASSILETRS
eukprot:s805_g7.t1